MGLYSAVTYLGVFAGTSGFKPIFTEIGFNVCAFVSALFILPAIIDAVHGLNHRKR